MKQEDLLGKVKDLARATEETRQGVKEAKGKINQYDNPNEWKHYSVQDTLLSEALQELKGFNHDVERCIVPGHCEEWEELERRYEVVCRALEEKVFGATKGVAGNQGG